MKTKILFILIFSSFSLAFSQKNKTEVVKEKVVIDSTKIYSQVEQQPEFPGGIFAFREKFFGVFDTSKVDGDSGRIICDIKFVIDPSGKITEVKASGHHVRFNEEAVRAIKSITTLWTPAKINNQPVRYSYRLPVVMQF